MKMKTITVALPADIVRRGRIEAATREMKFKQWVAVALRFAIRANRKPAQKSEPA